VITIANGVLERTFEHLRECGGDTRECVVLWAGPQAQQDFADEVIHPLHTASPGGYDIDGPYVSRLWRELAGRHQTVRVQVHTHPHSAYHSSRDDMLALVHTPGYLSLVIPNFAQGPIGLDGCYLAIRREDGSWESIDPRSTINVGP
jgi:proteasome lid subunit RPN8/RPN11